MGKTVTKVAKVSDLHFIVRPEQPDEKILDEIINKKVYNHLKFPLAKAKVILDIGAYIGDYAVYAAKLATNGMVYACEPNPENFQLLEENIKLNKLTNVKPFKLALADKRGVSTFSISNATATAGSIMTGGTGENYEVQTTTLKDFVQNNLIEHINILKIDIEGAEYPLLYASETILPNIDLITLEYHDLQNAPSEYNHIALEKFLKKNGFEVEYSTRNNFLLDAIGVGNMFAYKKF